MVEDFASVVINKPVHEVFRYVANAENIPSWVKGARVKKLSEGPFGQNTIFQQNWIRLKVTHYQEDRGFEAESITIHFPANLIVRRTHGYLSFESQGEGTRFTV